MRHPVKFFQSFYNYRAKGYHNHNKSYIVPPAETLVGDKHFLGCGTISARYEHYLMRLRKTNKTTESEWSPLKIFLCITDQLDHKDEGRWGSFRETLSFFLDLSKSMEKFNTVNMKVPYDNMINICDSKYDLLRSELMD